MYDGTDTWMGIGIPENESRVLLLKTLGDNLLIALRTYAVLSYLNVIEFKAIRVIGQ